MMIEGPHFVIGADDERYPDEFRNLAEPPERLYLIGNPAVLVPGLAVIGARKATPYGQTCARRFSRMAAERGVCIVSGGARGCDSEAHRAALEANGVTVAVLGGGCDQVYPKGNAPLFQRIVDTGGVVMSEHDWDAPPLPFMFRQRNRLIAALSFAVLIVEAGLPSGTFSTADEALNLGKEVLVVPGAITSYTSRGANRLLLQGASPVVDDESFEDALFRAGGMLKFETSGRLDSEEQSVIVAALRAEPLTMEELHGLAVKRYGPARARDELMEQLALAEAAGKIARNPDGTWGPALAAGAV